MLGEAVYDEILASERRRLHGAYAVALADRPTADGAAGASQLAALAFHAEAANEVALALRASIASARASAATSGFFEAARAYERAIALWDMVPAPDRPEGEDHVELLFETSGAFQTAEDPERGRDVARLAVAAVDPVREPLRSARLEERLAWATYLAGDLASATGLVQRWPIGSMASRRHLKLPGASRVSRPSRSTAGSTDRPRTSPSEPSR